MKFPLVLSALMVAVALNPIVTGAESANLVLARQLNQAYVEVAEQVMPSVVVITVRQKHVFTSLDEGEEDSGERSPRDLWREFHRRMLEPESIGQGSGVIIRKDGYILSNRHVVEDASEITVKLKDGRSFKATVRGVDPQSDVAVLKIEADDLPVATLGDSTKTRVGEIAIAVGAPFNFDYSVTFGHVSAKSRGDVVPFYAGGNIMDQDFIQTDANINPGSSGGPLVNIDGEVIGINTLIRGLQTGIGFAIPSNLAREVADEIIANGKFTRAWLGISIQALREDPDYSKLVKGTDDGVIVKAILPDGPASKSKLRPSDIIVSVDGKSVSTPQDLRNEIRGKRIGRAVALDVVRAGSRMEVEVKPGEWIQESPTPEVKPEVVENKPSKIEPGLTVKALTRDLAERFDAATVEGVVVATVEQDSLAARRGIKPGDVITALDNKPVFNPRDFEKAVKSADFTRGLIVNLVSERTARFEILKAESE